METGDYFEEDGLPADVRALLDMYGLETSGGDSTSDKPGTGEFPGGVGVADPGDGSSRGAPSGVEPSVDVRVPPAERLAERVFHPSAGFSLRPPEGWSVKTGEEAFQVLGPPVDDGWMPSFNLIRLPGEEISWEESIALLREQQSDILQDFEILAEDERQLAGGLISHEVLCKGLMGGRELVVRQVLIPVADELWLFSGFSTDGLGDVAFSLVNESLKTIEFTR